MRVDSELVDTAFSITIDSMIEIRDWFSEGIAGMLHGISSTGHGGKVISR